MIEIRFACGHVLQCDAAKLPVCPTCGNDRITYVKAPPPRFRGSATGPLVENSK